MKVKVLVTQSCPPLCDPMDCSPPGSSVNGILQARILEWVAIPIETEFCQAERKRNGIQEREEVGGLEPISSGVKGHGCIWEMPADLCG